jgi:hypothetical protein
MAGRLVSAAGGRPVTTELTPAKRAWLMAEREALEQALYDQIIAAGLPVPVRQFRYAPPRRVRDGRILVFPAR